MTIIYILDILGISNTLYLLWQHHQLNTHNKPMVCPLRGSCEAVTQSKYSRFFGIRNEYLGILFYITVFFCIYLLNNPAYLELAHSTLLLLRILVASATLFSVYLLYVQLSILKKVCTWCVISSILNIGLCIAVFLLL
jgi:uncharacterized membrane protein